MTSFKMLLFLFFLYLIKYSQINVNMSHYDSMFFLFPYICSDFCIMYIYSFVFKVSNTLWCLSSLWIVPFLIKNIHLWKKNVFGKYVPPVYGLSSHSLEIVFWREKVFILRKSSLSVISFMDPAFGVISNITVIPKANKAYVISYIILD